MAGTGGTPRNALAVLDGYTGAVVVGHGRYSVVYRAYEEASGADIAIKVFTGVTDAGEGEDPTDDAEARATFERERRVLPALTQHPALVTVFDTGYTTAGRPYVVMELMAGGSLAERLAAAGPLPWEQVVEVGARVAGGLEAAHREGLVHRDVQPDNLLISAGGEVRLSGFAVAAMHGAGASAVSAAPEVLAGNAATAASDQYELAATLLGLLFRRPAFGPRQTLDEPDVVTNTPASRVAGLRDSGVPIGVCIALERALAADPGARYESVAGFGAALGAEAHDAAPAVAPSSSEETASTLVFASQPEPQPEPHPQPPPEPQPQPEPLPPAAVVATVTESFDAGPVLADFVTGSGGGAAGPTTSRSRRRVVAVGALAGILLAGFGGLAYALTNGSDHHSASPATHAPRTTPPTAPATNTTPPVPSTRRTQTSVTVAPVTAAATTTPTVPPPLPPARPRVSLAGPGVIEDNVDAVFVPRGSDANSGQWFFRGDRPIPVNSLHWRPGTTFVVHPGCIDVGGTFTVGLTVSGPGGSSSTSMVFHVVDTNGSCDWQHS